MHKFKRYFLCILFTLWIQINFTIAILNNQKFQYVYYHQQPQQFFSELNLGEKLTNFYVPIKLNNTKIKPTTHFPVRSKKFLTNEIEEPTNYSKFLQELIGQHRKPSDNYYLPNSKTGTGLDIESFQKYYIDSTSNQPRTKTNAVFPGTIWCGPGNKAPSENSVGIFYRTDNCCREHDKCPDTIPPDLTLNGLHNNGYFTRSHCDCDRNFYMCLKEANTFVSFKVGFAYFNILRPQCFRLEYPVVQCSQSYLRKCVSYAVDNSQEKIWQWFDNHPF